jgi:hypothetical protein
LGFRFFLLGFPRLKLMSRLPDSADRNRPPFSDASIKGAVVDAEPLSLAMISRPL